MKTVEVITEQLDLLELQLRVATLFVREAQERSLFRPCRYGSADGCFACRTKRYILKERYS